ncbi:MULTISPECIES: helix-turn-helix domain-containing protein [unclassified Anaeromyxobacter]|uniref:helix-turn-helix domain-containing protein n=1 Tax=unclassified Anaeromyxobacter TaxID=2620896 RepID=UPI001F55BA2A|nr:MULTISPECIES: helix-turn-helix transcriptional regulator [unclassified Anaeromyxobacter]
MPKHVGDGPADPRVVALGQAIAFLREQRGLSQAQLAAHIGVSQPTLSRFERGVGQPDALTMHRLASTLGMSMDELHRRIDQALNGAKRASAATIGNESGADWWDSAVAAAGVLAVVGLIGFAIAAVFGGGKSVGK